MTSRIPKNMCLERAFWKGDYNDGFLYWKIYTMHC